MKPFRTLIFPPATHPGGRKGFAKGEALRGFRTNSSRATFEENVYKFKSRVRAQ